MRVVFIGSVAFSRRALERLIELQADIAGVCTLEGSNFNADHCDLSELSAMHRIPWTYAPRINSDATVQWIADKTPHVIFCFGWSQLLGPEVLRLAPLGVVGFHPAALPANRGRHPIIWALVLGLRETASTFFFMDEGADSGDILSQERIAISDDDTSGSLYEKVTVVGVKQIEQFVPQLEAGTFDRIKQNDREANTWRKRGTRDGQIDWRMSSRSIHNLVRGLAKPYVGAHFMYRGKEVKVWATEIVEGVRRNLEPGKVLDVTSKGAVVRCGDEGIRLVSTQPAFSPTRGEYL